MKSFVNVSNESFLVNCNHFEWNQSQPFVIIINVIINCENKIMAKTK